MHFYQTLNDSILLSSYYTFAAISIIGILLSNNNPNLRWLFTFLLAMRIIDTYLLIPVHSWLVQNQSFNDYIELAIYLSWAFTNWLCYRFILMRPLYSLKIARKLPLFTSQQLPGIYQPTITKAEYLLAHIYACFVFTKLLAAFYMLIKLGFAQTIPAGQHQWLVNINALITGQQSTPLLALMSLSRASDLLLTAAEYSALTYLIFTKLLYPSMFTTSTTKDNNNVRA